MPASYEVVNKIIQTTEWYDQGGSTRILYMTSPLPPAVYNIFNVHKIGYWRIVAFSLDNKGTWGLSLKGLKQFSQYVWGQHQRDPAYLPALESLQDRLEKELDHMIANLQELPELTDTLVKERLRQACALLEEVWKPFIFADSFDLLWEEMFKKVLDEHYPQRLTDDEMKALLHPDEMSFVQQEEVELLKIKKNFSMKKLQAHQQRYYWYKTNYNYIDAQPLSHFQERLNQITDPNSELQRIISKQKRFQVEKKKILKKHQLPIPVKKFIELLVILTKRRDVRKRCNSKGSYMVKVIVQEIANRRGIEYQLLEQIAFPEIVRRAFTITKKELKSIRNKCCVLYDEKTKASVFYGKKAERLKEVYEKAIAKEHTEIKGMPACKGIGRGTVKIIEHVEEFSKMKKGDILVSYMTRPEFVPVMKLAAAIVTNEGGITSHAAIVSRELSIPCIVGTHIATKLLKDGDIVEVDANKGVVRKIK